jgi:hypothetical protein
VADDDDFNRRQQLLDRCTTGLRSGHYLHDDGRLDQRFSDFQGWLCFLDRYRFGKLRTAGHWIIKRTQVINYRPRRQQQQDQQAGSTHPPVQLAPESRLLVRRCRGHAKHGGSWRGGGFGGTASRSNCHLGSLFRL